MKKVLIGILFLIPVIILLLVAAVSSVVSTTAHIAVESITISSISGEKSLVFNLSEIGNQVVDLNEYLKVEILPEKATNKVVEWSITDLVCFDEEYEESYLKYKQDQSLGKVNPAAMFIDDNGEEVMSNSTGLLRINAYSSFTIKVSAEQFSDSILCYVVGYDVEKIKLVDKDKNESTSLKVGESIKLYPNYTPIDSIINDVVWFSSDESILSVDSNGVVTALKEGNAYIYQEAAIYSKEGEYVKSSEYFVEVAKSSSIFGSSFYTHLNSLNLSELGIEGASVVSGGEISSDTLTIVDEIVKLTTTNGDLTIRKCTEDEIVINNLKFLDSSSGEVVEVNGIELILSISYKSKSLSSIPVVTWSSSNNDIATVNENGVVIAKSSGLVLITATSASSSVSIELNAQKKITSMQLKTSNSYYEKGLARETVFASERYASFNKDTLTNITKQDNYTYIIIEGAEDLSGDELKEFLNAYNFEVVDGKNYAQFDKDEVNKLVFSDALEEKGRQQIKVKVSAKYPKYITQTTYTQEEVTINVIYGIEVNNIYELLYAAREQRVYAFKEGNLIATTGDINVCYNTNRVSYVSSKNGYAISIMSDIIYPRDIKDICYTDLYKVDPNDYSEYRDKEKDNDPVEENKEEEDPPPSAMLFSSLYGNNHMVASWRHIFDDKYNEIIHVAWSDVEVSNIILRPSQLEGSSEIISGDETSELLGKAIYVSNCINGDKFRLQNVRIEYSIMENAYQMLSFNNADVEIDGCIIRNLCNVGAHLAAKVFTDDENQYVKYSHINIHNCIVSNALGSLFSISQDGMAKDKKTGINKFYKDDAQNEKYVRDTFCARNFCNVLNQTGFLDAYNWQSTESAKLIQSGNDTVDSLLAGLTEGILMIDLFEPFRFRYKGVDYFHLGFITSGIATGDTMFVEPNFSKVYCEDERFDSFSLQDLSNEDDALLATVSRFTLTIYGYRNDSNIRPSSTYVINEKLINKLHE